MNDAEFATLSGAALDRIEQQLEASGADLDFDLAAGGVLEIEFADGSKIIVSPHMIAQELWVAARSGGFHFRLDDNQGWVDTRTGESLDQRLTEIIKQQGQVALKLS